MFTLKKGQYKTQDYQLLVKFGKQFLPCMEYIFKHSSNIYFFSIHAVEGLLCIVSIVGFPILVNKRRLILFCERASTSASSRLGTKHTYFGSRLWTSATRCYAKDPFLKKVLGPVNVLNHVLAVELSGIHTFL